MEKQELDVRIFEGLGKIDFGIRTEEMIELLGEANSAEEITDDDDDEQTIMYTYEDMLTSFFISGEGKKMILISCDTENPDVTLFGEKIFSYTEEQIIKLFADKDFVTYEMEVEEWGETRLSFPELLVDFYMEDKKVMSLTWGFRYDEE